MNWPHSVSELVGLVAGHSLLLRLLFTSLEFAALALLVGLLISIFRIRSPRLVALLWLVVLAKPLAGLVIGTPLPILLIKLTTPTQLAVPAQPVSPSGPDSSMIVPEILTTIEPGKSLPASSIDYGSLILHTLTGLWLAGVGVFVLLALVDHLRLRRLLKASRQPEPRLAAHFKAVADNMSLRRLPRLRVTDVLESPALAGLFPSTILLPDWLAEEMDPARLDWSLRHELMHWKMRDPLAGLVYLLSRTLFFFHPAAWWAGRKWKEAMEMACDRALISSIQDAEHYAEQLYKMLVKVHTRRQVSLAGGFFASRTQISRRIAALLGNPLHTSARLSALTLLFVVILSAASLTVGLGVKSEAQATAPKPAVKKAAPAKGEVKFDPMPDHVTADTINYTNDKTIHLAGRTDVWYKLGNETVKILGEKITIHPVQNGLVLIEVKEKFAGKTDTITKAIQVSADKITYDPKLESFRLAGNAYVLQKHGDRVTKSSGDVITLQKDIKTNRTQISISQGHHGATPRIEEIIANAAEAKPGEKSPTPMTVEEIEIGLNRTPIEKLTANNVNYDEASRRQILEGKVVVRCNLAGTRIDILGERMVNSIVQDVVSTFLIVKRSENLSPTPRTHSDAGIIKATADKATIDSRQKSLTLEGNVTLIIPDFKKNLANKIVTDKAIIQIGADNLPKVRVESIPASKMQKAHVESIPLPEGNPPDVKTVAVAVSNISSTATQKAEQPKEVSLADKMAAENFAMRGWQLLWGQHKLAEAEAEFQKAVEKDPTSAKAWNGLGWAQLNQGKPLNAKQSFEQCLAVNPKASAALNGLGYIAKGAGKNEEAIAYWKKAIVADPGATASLAGLAKTYEEMGQPKEAEKYYQMWLKAEPGSAEAKAALEKMKSRAADKTSFNEKDLQ